MDEKTDADETTQRISLLLLFLLVLLVCSVFLQAIFCATLFVASWLTDLLAHRPNDGSLQDESDSDAGL